MKRIAWSAFAVFFAVTLVGCALPEKKAVSVPTSQTYPSQPLPVYTPDSTVPKSLQTPGVLEIEAQPEVVIEEGIETTLPSMIFINDRIFEYGRKLERWKELDSQSVNIELGDEEAAQMVRCFRRLQTVMNGYSDLRSVILQSHEVVKVQAITNEEIFTLQKDDIAFVESSCGRLLSDSENKSVDWSQREEGSDLTQLETLIDRYAENNENEEIIQVWEKIPEFQHGRVHLRTKILYGNALMYLHQQEKAADIYLQVVNQMSDSDAQATDIVSLRKILADLYIASGNYKKATVQYKKISDD